MKREIACAKCVENWDVIARDPADAGEQVDVVRGVAQRDMLCDDCGIPVDPGMECAAITVTTPEQRPYRYWAWDYVKRRTA